MEVVLSGVPLFSALDPEGAAALRASMQEVRFGKGDVVFAEGSDGDRLYVVSDGKMKLGHAASDGRETLLAVMGPGDMFGELSLFDPGPRTATATALTDTGLAYGLVYEDEAGAPLGGYARGQANGQRAEQQAANVGFPADRPIYHAVDFDVQPGQYAALDAYMAGVQSVSSRPFGWYGHYGLVERYGASGTVSYLWQCAAWSGNGNGSGGSIDGRRVSKYACLFQKVGYVLGNTCDANEVLRADWGQNNTTGTPTPTPPPPTPTGDVLMVPHVLDGRFFLLTPHAGSPHGFAWQALDNPTTVADLYSTGVADPTRTVTLGKGGPDDERFERYAVLAPDGTVERAPLR